MAKQTFTTGQVLTAAQMTSLQQTAMLGGAASAKTASYTLVAADAGTAITMSNASATTITVNTTLFAAGDVVNITNLGAGVCTITAGTATVNTSATLALAQYESGTLDFISTSSAVFVKGAGAAPSAGGADWTLLNSGGTALTGAATVTISGISGKDKILVLFESASSTGNYAQVGVRINTDTGNNYNSFGTKIEWPSTRGVRDLIPVADTNVSSIRVMGLASGPSSYGAGYCLLTGTNSSGVKQFVASGTGYNVDPTEYAAFVNTGGFYNSASTVTSVSAFSSVGTFDNGTVYVYTSA
jgi:hypothetical protein